MALSVDTRSLTKCAAEYDRVAAEVKTACTADPSLTQAIESSHGPAGAALSAAFDHFQAELQRAGAQIAQLHSDHADRLRMAADRYTTADQDGADRISAASQTTESGQRSAVQMVSSETSQGAGSSGTGPRVPPSIVGTPRPVWPNGVPKV
ncbi:PE domain-containing protein [Mycolicibacterium porcinum]|uniref:type VII secretion target n=1 Tax=Mycolicibacterium porcinum TaxID=39693 RepID=UPI0009F19F1B|nr:PE domain-containing protein [Mycolicibacterium porcinum]